MHFFNNIFKKRKKKSIPNHMLKEMEHKEAKVKAEWNAPKYIIDFPDKEKPFVPYFYIEGQAEQWIEAPSNGHFYYDPIEDFPEFQEINSIVEQLVDEELADRKNLMGSCHWAWSIKKRLLEEQYGIKWHSVADLNPMCNFD